MGKTKTPVLLIIVLALFFKTSAQNKQVNNSNEPDSIIFLDIFSVYNKNYFFPSTNALEFSFNGGRALSECLQGKISGVDVINLSGEPGRASQIVIQGLNISGKRQPLILIDGIPQHKQENIFNYYNNYSEDIFSLIPIASQDVQSIKILKSPISTVLFGVEGIDGVILIETKDGGEQTLSVDYRYNLGIHFKPEYPSMLNGEEYVMLQLDEWHNAFGVFDVPPEIAYDNDYVDFYNYSANTDWLEAVTQKGFSSNHYLSIYGKKNKIRYFTSVDYKDETGTLINTGYNRFLNKTKIDVFFTKKLSASLNLSYSNHKYDGNYVIKDESSNDRNILEMAYIKSPNMSIWKYDTDGNLTNEYFLPRINYQGDGRYYYNPIAVSQLGDTKKNINELESTLHLKSVIKNWLQLEELFTFNNIAANSIATLPYAALSSELFLEQDIHEYEFNFTANRYRTETRALLKVPFQNEEKNILQGSIVWISRYLDSSLSSNSNTMIFDADFSELLKNSALASLNYKLNNRYFIDINTNLESYSRTNSETNWNSHYGVFIGWEFTNETFMEKDGNIGQGNLHAGFSFSDYNYNLIFPYNSSFLSPEQTLHSFNIGLDFNLFDEKLAIETIYLKRNIDSDVNLDSSQKSFGISSRGIEGSITYSIVSRKERLCKVYLNIASNNFIWNSVPENANSMSGGLSNGQYITYVREGDSPGSIFGVKYLGVYSTDEDAFAKDKQGNIIYDGDGNPLPISYYGNYIFKGGDVKYYDPNFDGVIDGNDIFYLGNSYPKVTGGFGTYVKFKRISVAINFHYRFGYEIINQVAMDSESMNTKNNQTLSALERWRSPGQNEDEMLHRAYLFHPANNLGSDLYVESGDFLRLNNISFGYSLEPSVCQKLHLNSLQFNLSVQRLFTFTNYMGLDPEIETRYSTGWLRRDEMRAYPAQVIRFGFQLGI